ncbi:MAG: tyrosine-type recombinase/integrase [Acidimicrobiales bacterium]
MERSLIAVISVAAAHAGLDPGEAGRSKIDQFRWNELDYRSAVALRGALRARYAPATANRHLAAIRGVVRSAVLMGGISRTEGDAAIAGLKSVRGETLPAGRMIATGEMEAMFRSMALAGTTGACRDAALLAVLAGTGARRAEVAALDLGDWDPRTGELTIRKAKGGRQRHAYLHGGAVAALDAWLDERGSEPGPIFVAVRKDGCVDPERKRLSTTAIWRRSQQIAARSGVPATSPHDYRRTVASTLLDKAADIAIVAALLGHRQVSTTARYDRRPAEARQRAAEMIHVPYVAPTPRSVAGASSVVDFDAVGGESRAGRQTFRGISPAQPTY